ncbi:hypothetical protein ABID22_003436 [Pontibacter aydingkolensis]
MGQYLIYILDSEMFFMFSVICFFWMPFYIYAKLYFMIALKNYKLKDIVILIGFFGALLSIFFGVFDETQRLFMFSFIVLLLIGLSVYLIVRRFMLGKWR